MTTSVLFSTSIAAADSAGPTVVQRRQHQGVLQIGLAPHRTTSTVPPLATRPAASAAENVAMPHAVGGKQESIPNDRPASAPKGTTGKGRVWLPTTEVLTSALEASGLR